MLELTFLHYTSYRKKKCKQGCPIEILEMCYITIIQSSRTGFTQTVPNLIGSAVRTSPQMNQWKTLVCLTQQVCVTLLHHMGAKFNYIGLRLALNVWELGEKPYLWLPMDTSAYSCIWTTQLYLWMYVYICMDSYIYINKYTHTVWAPAPPVFIQSWLPPSFLPVWLPPSRVIYSFLADLCVIYLFSFFWSLPRAPVGVCTFCGSSCIRVTDCVSRRWQFTLLQPSENTHTHTWHVHVLQRGSIPSWVFDDVIDFFIPSLSLRVCVWGRWRPIVSSASVYLCFSLWVPLVPCHCRASCACLWAPLQYSSWQWRELCCIYTRRGGAVCVWGFHCLFGRGRGRNVRDRGGGAH